MRVDRLCLLSIDPARSSGWAIWAGRVLHDSGTALTAQDRADAIERWLLLAATKNLVRAVVAESWSPGMLSHATMFGCGASYGRWLERIEDSGYREDHILRYMPAQWRKIVGIRSRGRVACKAEAIRTVARLYNVVADEDQAEAILIGKAALTDTPSLCKVLPGRVRKLLLVDDEPTTLEGVR